MPNCSDCGYPVLEDMVICPTCGKALGAPRFCVGCEKRITQDRFNNYQGRCVSCTRKFRAPIYIGFALIFAVIAALAVGYWLAFGPFGQWSSPLPGIVVICISGIILLVLIWFVYQRMQELQ